MASGRAPADRQRARLGVLREEGPGHERLLRRAGVHRSRRAVLGSVRAGAIVGLTRGVNKYHIIRATLESLAFQTNGLLKAMESDSGIPITSLKVDGGASRNNLLMQFQADISNVPVTRPECVETTALGAAYLAGLAVGYFANKDEILRKWRFGDAFKPEMTEEERTRKIAGWGHAVERALRWEDEE